MMMMVVDGWAARRGKKGCLEDKEIPAREIPFFFLLVVLS
jgi:hypothetical protein